jgi:hypothetical protein
MPLPPMPQLPGKDMFLKPVIENYVDKGKIEEEVNE